MEILVVKMTIRYTYKGKEVTSRNRDSIKQKAKTNKIMKATSISEQLKTKVLSQKTIKIIKLVRYTNLCHSTWHLSLIQLPGKPTLSLLLNTAKKWAKDNRISK